MYYNNVQLERSRSRETVSHICSVHRLDALYLMYKRHSYHAKGITLLACCNRFDLRGISSRATLTILKYSRRCTSAL